MAVPVPLVNGIYYSYADIELSIFAGLYVGSKSINYGHKLQRQYVRGSNPEPIGVTRGQYEPTADIELYRPQANYLIATLGIAAAALGGAGGNGYMEVPFTITVSFISAILGVVTDTIQQCYITAEDISNSEGLDAATVKFTLMPQRILRNGSAAVLIPLTGIGTVG